MSLHACFACGICSLIIVVFVAVVVFVFVVAAVVAVATATAAATAAAADAAFVVLISCVAVVFPMLNFCAQLHHQAFLAKTATC